MAAPSSDFEALYGQATELAKAFPEYQFKTVTAMLVVLGWLISSDSAQLFIRQHSDYSLPLGVFAFALLAVLKTIWIYGHVRRMQSLHVRLLQLAPLHGLTPEALSQLNLGTFLPASYVVVNVVLCAAGSVVLWLVCS